MLLPIEMYRESERGIFELYEQNPELYERIRELRLKNAQESIEWHMSWARKHKQLDMPYDYHVERARHFCRKWRAIPKEAS